MVIIVMINMIIIIVVMVNIIMVNMIIIIVVMVNKVIIILLTISNSTAMINTGEQRGPDVAVSRLVDAPGKLEPREKRTTWRNPVSYSEAQNTFLL